MINVEEWRAMAPEMFLDELNVIPTLQCFTYNEQNGDYNLEEPWVSFAVNDHYVNCCTSNNLAAMYMRPAIRTLANAVEKLIVQKLVADLYNINRSPILPHLTWDNIENELEHAKRILNNHNAGPQRFLWYQGTEEELFPPLGGFVSNVLSSTVGTLPPGLALAWDKEAIGCQYALRMQIDESRRIYQQETTVRLSVSTAVWVIVPNRIIIFKNQ